MLHVVSRCMEVDGPDLLDACRSLIGLQGELVFREPHK